MKLEHFLTPYIKINSKWIKDLNLKMETMKPLEEKTDRTLLDINLRNIFFRSVPKAKETKANINK